MFCWSGPRTAVTAAPGTFYMSQGAFEPIESRIIEPRVLNQRLRPPPVKIEAGRAALNGCGFAFLSISPPGQGDSVHVSRINQYEVYRYER